MKTIRPTTAAELMAVALLAGCGGEIGPTGTQVIDVPKPAGLTQTWDVELSLGAAQVTVGSKGERLVQGTITYNAAGLRPVVSVKHRRVQIRQDVYGVLPIHTRNEWRLQLGRGVPMNLKVKTGASSDEWDLGGLSLRRLSWAQGAGTARLTFSEPNPERLDRLTITGGAAALIVRGLANANLAVAYVNAGVGAVMLVFDGQLSQDGKVMLNGGVSSIALCSGGNPIRLTAEGRLRAILNTGWSQSGNVYYSPEWASASGPKLTIRARLGLSALELLAGTCRFTPTLAW